MIPDLLARRYDQAVGQKPRTHKNSESVVRVRIVPRIRAHNLVKLRPLDSQKLFMQGVHPKVVSELLGHGSIELALDTYSHVLPAMHQHTADALDRILSG